MNDAALTPQQFQEAEVSGDWRALNAGADAWFDAPSLRAGAALVRRVGDVAEAAGHHPDVDLRASGVHVRTYSHDTDSLTTRDMSLAGQISAAAAELGLTANAAATQRLQLPIPCSASRGCGSRRWTGLVPCATGSMWMPALPGIQ